LNKYKIVSEYEYLFYVDTIRKKKLSDKQQPIRCRINQKLIDYTDINSPLIKIGAIEILCTTFPITPPGD